MQTALLSVLLALASALNIAATVLVLRADYLLRGQRLAQIALVWLVPFVGFVIVIAVLRFSGSTRASSEEGSTASSDYAWTISNTPDAATFHDHSAARDPLSFSKNNLNSGKMPRLKVKPELIGSPRINLCR